MQEQEAMRHAEKAGLTTTKLENKSDEIVNAMGESLSNLTNSDDEEDGGIEDDDGNTTELEKLREVDAAGWVMSTISKIVQQHMEIFQLMQRRLDELMHLGWG